MGDTETAGVSTDASADADQAAPQAPPADPHPLLSRREIASPSGATGASGGPVVHAAPGGSHAVTVDHEHIITPRPQAFTQFDGRWGNALMRPPYPQAAPPPGRAPRAPRRADDDWQANGCCPTSIATVVRWWAEVNTKTSGNVQIARGGAIEPIRSPSVTADGAAPAAPAQGAGAPGGSAAAPAATPETTEALTASYDSPLSVAYDLWRFDFDPPAVTRAPPASTHGVATFSPREPYVPYEPGGHRTWNVQYTRIIRSLSRLRWSNGGRAVPMSVDLGGRSRARLLHLLQRGPVLANMTHPGHWVVVYGLQGGRVYICDPGAVLANHWANVGDEPTLRGDAYQRSLRDHPDWYQDPAFTHPTAPGSNINVAGSDSAYVDVDERFQFSLLDTQKVGPNGQAPGDLTRYVRRPPMTWMESLILLACPYFPGGYP